MAGAEGLLDPALPATLPWGMLQPIWWLMIIILLGLLGAKWLRYRRLQLSLQPLKQLIQVLHPDNPLHIASQLKQVLLAYFPTEQVAPLAVDKALVFLHQKWHLSDVTVVAEWLARAVYQNDTSCPERLEEQLAKLQQTLQATLEGWR